MAKKRNYYNNTSTEDTTVEEEVEAVVEEAETEEVVEETVEDEIIESVEEVVEEEIKPVEVETTIPIIDTVTIIPTFTATENEPVKVASSNTTRVFTPGEYVKVMPNTPLYHISTGDMVCGRIKENTSVGFVDGAFNNSQEIKDKLNAVTVAKFMTDLKKKVADYYEGN